MTPSDIAKICHEANRAYCETLGDGSQQSWEKAEDWQRESALEGVAIDLENPDAPISVPHEAWLEEKRRTGWKYGETQDAKKKTHPFFVPYDELPLEQKAKDVLFRSIVHCLKPFLSKDATTREAA